MESKPRRRRAEPTEDWEQIELLCGWPEQRDYELIRPLVLFGGPASERAEETRAASERTLRRRAARFEAEGMESLFGSEAARRRKKLPPAMRRLIVDLKAEYPGFNPNEISRICYVRFGRRPCPQDGQARPRAGARPVAVRAPLPAVPRDPRAEGRPCGGGGAARRRLERQGDRATSGSVGRPSTGSSSAGPRRGPQVWRTGRTAGRPVSGR